MTAIRPGLCSVTLRALSPESVVEVCAEAGLSGIEWGADVHVPPGELAVAGGVARRCADAGVACASYGSYVRAGDRSDDAADLGAVLDTAQALGAPNVRVWTDWAGVTDTPTARRTEVADDLAAIADAAGARGLTVSIEFHAHTLTETAASTNRLLAEAGHPPNLFTNWQPMDGVAVPALLAELRAVRADLSHLHVFRWFSWEERLALTEGADLWPEALTIARPQPDDRWARDRVAFLEFVRADDVGQLRRDARVLRGWLDEPARDRSGQSGAK